MTAPAPQKGGLRALSRHLPARRQGCQAGQREAAGAPKGAGKAAGREALFKWGHEPKHEKGGGTKESWLEKHPPREGAPREDEAEGRALARLKSAKKNFETQEVATGKAEKKFGDKVSKPEPDLEARKAKAGRAKEENSSSLKKKIAEDLNNADASV